MFPVRLQFRRHTGEHDVASMFAYRFQYGAVLIKGMVRIGDEIEVLD